MHKDTLLAIDRNIRRVVRQTLRLPEDTPVAFFHAQVADGGLGIPAASTLVPLAKARCYHSLLSRDPLLAWAAADTFLAPGQSILRVLPVVGEVEVDSKEAAEKAWAAALYRSKDGAGLRDASSVATAWLRNPRIGADSAQFIGATALLAGVLPTATRPSRGGRGNGRIQCRGTVSDPSR